MNKPPVTRWSFSALKQYEKCPYATYLKRVERAPEPVVEDPSAPNVRGSRIHLEAEHFVRGEGPLTKDLRKFEEQFNELADLYAEGKVEVEQELGFDREWAPCGWSDPQCWAMIKLDAAVIVATHGRAIDYKTGKSFGNEVPHIQQTQLYAMSMFMKHPQLLTLSTELWYLDEGKTSKKTYIRTMLPALLPRWEQRANKMTNAMVFKPKANKSNCRFCSFGIENGTGRCAYAVGMDT